MIPRSESQRVLDDATGRFAVREQAWYKWAVAQGAANALTPFEQPPWYLIEDIQMTIADAVFGGVRCCCNQYRGIKN